ncbi:MAG TPA: YjgP/YjgQ family permease [bacterium]|nr:YjgP/YjgQ family permease [bacterium]
MKIISRYIIKEVAFVSFTGFFIFTFFLIMNSLFVMSDLVIKHGVGLFTVIHLLLLLLPSTVAVTIPMAVLVGILMTFSRLVQDNEYYGMQAGGISVRSIAMPVVWFSLFLMLCMVLFNNYVLPAANLSYKKVYFEIVKKRSSVLIQENTFIRDFDGYIFYTGGRDPRSGTLKNIIVIVKPKRQIKQDDPPKIIFARTGELMSDEESYRLILRLNDGVIQSASYEAPEKMNSIHFDTNFVDLDIGGVLRKREEPGDLKGTREMTIDELYQEMKKGPKSKHDINWVAIEFHKKTSLPFAIVAFAAVGIPLGLMTRRGGKITSIVFSLVLILAYYVLLSLGQNYGYRGQMNHFVSAWLPNLFLTGCGAVLFLFMLFPVIKRKTFRPRAPKK